MKQCGIYIIVNIKNFKAYVGQTKDFERRLEKHRQVYKQKAYKSFSKIYPAINKHGIENFIFCFLEECDPISMNKREQEWIKELDSFNNGYNATIGGSNPISYWNGKKRSKETNYKISKTLTGKKMSKESSLKKSAALKLAYKEGRKKLVKGFAGWNKKEKTICLRQSS